MKVGYINYTNSCFEIFDYIEGLERIPYDIKLKHKKKTNKDLDIITKLIITNLRSILT